MHAVPTLLEQPLSRGASGGQHDMLPHTDGVAGEPQGLRLRHRNPASVGNAVGNGLEAVGIKRRGKVEQLASAQRAETRIQMVKTRVGQFQRNDFPAKTRTQQRKHSNV